MLSIFRNLRTIITRILLHFTFSVLHFAVSLPFTFYIQRFTFFGCTLNTIIKFRILNCTYSLTQQLIDRLIKMLHILIKVLSRALPAESRIDLLHLAILANENRCWKDRHLIQHG